METLKEFVITLVTTMILITAVELIAPDNSMKKYLKFVLGLILIVVILNPILKFFNVGENELKNSISSYEKNLKEKESDNDINVDSNKLREESFKNNFNKNCENMLKNEFKDMEFKCEVDCNVDFKGVKFDISSINVYIKDKKVKKIVNVEKVEIDTSKESKKKENKNEEYKDVVNFLKSELEISESKINIYKMK
ncbi:MAG: stage III sporulation protein AF [Clostridium baratii]|uniref:stage III sporulation protein AF n=1 Tax=Clostridium baratii TaxID=1561 RepID=UPI0024310A9C|nr:stage III sporulation protein AF [Clostridium baratii]MBS6006929.1 stage III sporulation protein AF [Clostridium baratii]